MILNECIRCHQEKKNNKFYCQRCNDFIQEMIKSNSTSGSKAETELKREHRPLPINFNEPFYRSPEEALLQQILDVLIKIYARVKELE